MRGDVLEKDDVLDVLVLLAGDGRARLLDDDHGITRLGGSRERESDPRKESLGSPFMLRQARVRTSPR
jgi:hypothetical protein